MMNSFPSSQRKTNVFAGLIGQDVKPKDSFLSFTADQGGNVVDACGAPCVEVVKCNAHRLNSDTVWSLEIEVLARTTHVTTRR